MRTIGPFLRPLVKVGLAAVLLVGTGGCGTAGGGTTRPAPSPTSEAATAAGGKASPAQQTPDKVDCQAILAMTPAQAAATLEAAGWTVSWRLEHTLADGSSASDIVSEMPEGTLVNLLLQDGAAIVFVAPTGDPILENTGGNSCPAGVTSAGWS